MTFWLVLVGGIYLALMVYATTRAYRRTHSVEDYMMAGSRVGVFLGFLTFAATLFSTFTLMGMPDFFRLHGVGAWAFLAVSDGAMLFMLLWFGFAIRRRVRRSGFTGMSGLLRERCGTRWGGYVYFIGVFLFLIPYVAIQIRGLGIFLSAAFPGTMPVWGWALAIIVVMLAYSEVGGLKAIIYTDAIQGLLLLVVTWIVALGCIREFGSVREMFEAAGAVDSALLTVPGPQGLFTTQFLVASLFAIVFLPVTQPQLTTRLVIMRSTTTLKRMAVGVGIFMILVIMPTIAIGMFGAVHHAGTSTPEFLTDVLFRRQSPPIGALVAIGLIAAAMSTADSQIFALGAEIRSLLSGDERTIMLRTKAAIGFFAACAFVFAVLSSDQLVLLARVSFAGTALLGPLVLSVILGERKASSVLEWATSSGLAVFLASLSGVVPSEVAG
ncbi:MAG TPA: hypothetical protein VF190_15615, partial [Rhodothermales bacterium]